MSLTTVSQLQNLIHNQIGTHFRQPETENIPVAQSVGRVLAQDIVSPINVPNANVWTVTHSRIMRRLAMCCAWLVSQRLDMRFQVMWGRANACEL